VANNIIATVTLDDSNRGNFKSKFDQFIRTLQGAFNELSDLKVEVSPHQQVLHLLNRLVGHRDSNFCRSTIMASEELSNDFSKAVAHLETVLRTSGNEDRRSTRNVSAVSTTSSGRVPNEQWKAMTSEQRKAHLKKMRKKNADSTKGESGKKRKHEGDNKLSRSQKKEFTHLRNVESLAIDALSAMPSQNATPVTISTSNNPSEQFGSKIQALSAQIAKGKSNKD
jgi:hypothetical protein